MYAIRNRVTPRYMQLGAYGSGRTMNLNELQPPAQSGGGATVLDFGRDLLATASSIYFAKKQIDPAQYSPQIRVQVDPGQQTQDMTRNLMIGAGVLGVGVIALAMMKKRR